MKPLLKAVFLWECLKMAKTKDEYLADFRKWGLLGGRPKAFKSPKDMAEKIAAFLEACETRIVDKVTKTGVVKANIPAPTTVEDFCAFAGITKTTFYAYGDKPTFQPLVDYYKQIVEAYWVRQCAEGIPGNKADFILKNAFAGDWKEKSDVTMHGQVNLMPNVEFNGEKLVPDIGEAVDVEAAGNS